MTTPVYRHIYLVIALLFLINTSLLLVSSHGIWYLYFLSCILSYCILSRHAYRLECSQEGICISKPWKKKRWKWEEIHSVSLSESPYYPVRTIEIGILTENGRHEQYHIGTLPAAGHIKEIAAALEQRVKVIRRFGEGDTILR